MGRSHWRFFAAFFRTVNVILVAFTASFLFMPATLDFARDAHFLYIIFILRENAVAQISNLVEVVDMNIATQCSKIWIGSNFLLYENTVRTGIQ